MEVEVARQISCPAQFTSYRPRKSMTRLQSRIRRRMSGFRGPPIPHKSESGRRDESPLPASMESGMRDSSDRIQGAPIANRSPFRRRVSGDSLARVALKELRNFLFASFEDVPNSGRHLVRE